MSRATGPYPWYTLFYRRPHLLVLSIIIILVAGMSALGTLPRLEDPRIDTRNALVITPYPGASAEQVEALVTDVLEDHLREIFEVKEIKSTSRAGISVITVEMQDWIDNSNNEALFSEIRDTITAARAEFPPGVAVPIFDEKRAATAFTLLLAIHPAENQTLPLTMQGRFARELADTLRNVPGTELVRQYGLPEEEVVVQIDPAKLAGTGLTVDGVSQRIGAADTKRPAGTIYSEGRDLRLSMSEQLDSLSVIRDIPLINRDGRYLRVGDIADVSLGYKSPAQSIAMLDGERVILVGARMQTTVRSDTWTQAVMQVVNDFNRQHQASVTADIAFEQNHYTEKRLSELSQNLLMGCAVVMLVIMLFMGLRASLIVGLALPLCAAFALFSLSFYNEQIHQMSIFGMIIAIGLLIDNAIVITDEIRINLKDHQLTRVGAMAKSVRHLFAPLLASTLTTILGFMPIFLLNGNIGDFISSIAISVVMALIGSLFISLTIIAALAARFLPRRDDASQKPWWIRGLNTPSLTAHFKAALAGWLQRPLLVCSIIVLVCLAGFGLSSRLANVFFPSADRDQFEVYVWLPEGTTIDHTFARAQAMDKVLRQTDGVSQVSWLVGGSAPSVYYNQIMLRDNMPYFANAVITTSSVAKAQALISELQYSLQSQFTDTQVVVRAFGQGPPIPAPIEVDIIGPDLDVLNKLGQEVRLAMTDIPGITQSIATITLNDPEFSVVADDSTLSFTGSSVGVLANLLDSFTTGRSQGSLLEGTEDIPVRVRLNDAGRKNPSLLGATPVGLENGDWVSLSAVADLSLTPAFSSITREAGQRLNRVQAFLRPGVPAVDVSNRLRTLLAEQVTLPPGYRFKMAGDADEQQQALGQLATYAPVLLVLMVTTLILTFTSLRMAAVIATVAVLSVGLGMMSLWVSGLPVGFNPLLGSAGLIGVAINGSIVVIAAINANPQAREGRTRAVVEETMGCSRHILSTTFTTVGGLIPLLLFSEGSFWPPLAVVLAGGVGFSVILSLVFTPALVAMLYRRRAARQVS